MGWDVSKDEHDVLHYFFIKWKFKHIYLNLVSSSNHIKINFEGVERATLGIRIMVGS